MSRYRGGCHCGNIQVRFETEITPDEFIPRACQCSFCRKHSTRALSDPSGHIHLTVKSGDVLSRYQFGTKSTEFLVCTNCGVYVSAYMPDGDRAYANVMANALHDCDAFGPGIATDLSSEEKEGKRERRRQMWSPATLTIKS